MPIFALGARLAPPDPRNYKAADFVATVPALPPELDLSPCLQPPRNQGGLGSCTGHAVAATLYGYLETFGADARHRVVSPMDAYMGGRSLEVPMPAPNQEGCLLQKVLEYARLTGLCLEADWPYVPTEAPGTPGHLAAVHRGENKLKAYAMADLGDIAGTKALIMQSGALPAAGPIDEGWFEAAPDGTIKETGKVAGGHAYGIIGWSDEREAWKVRNSWGEGWGDHGNAWIPYGSAQIQEAYGAVQGFMPDGTIAPPPPPFIQWLGEVADRLGIHIPGLNA